MIHFLDRAPTIRSVTAVGLSMRSIAAAIMLAQSGSACAFLPTAERDVLVAIYNATGGPNWTNHTGWLGKPRTECGWYRVQCDAAGDHVIRLVLSSNNLTGSLPATISGLPSLIQFSVDHNQLTGPLSTFSNLPALSIIDIEYNQLTGPVTDLTGLPALAYVYADHNQLSALAPLSGMSSLKHFSARFNALSGTIPEMSALPSLQYFLVSDNSLTGALPSLSSLSSLAAIWVHNNALYGTLPLTPFPDNLAGGSSTLCPNRFDARNDPAWDFATGMSPWWTVCDTLFENGFEP
jgi:hypothetical protein